MFLFSLNPLFRSIDPVFNGTQGRKEARGEEAGRREEAGDGREEACSGEGSGREEAQGGEENSRQGRSGEEEEEEVEEVHGDLQDLHLQGAEAGAPRYRDLEQGDEYYELVHQRHLREACSGVFSPCPIQ